MAGVDVPLAAAAAVAVGYRRDVVGFGLVVLVVRFLSVPVVGAAVVRTDRRNAFGWILLTCGVSTPLAVTAYLYSHAGLPAFGLAAWLDGWPWTPALTLVPVVGLLLLPDGHPPSRRWSRTWSTTTSPSTVPSTPRPSTSPAIPASPAPPR